MKFLLPYRFKRWGLWMAPVGFFMWMLMQLGYLQRLLIMLFGASNERPAYLTANVSVAIVSFFAFLIGMYFLAFSREKEEDEMVQKLRLESFQFAALIQMLVGSVSLVLMGFLWSPPEGLLMAFFIGLILLFWLAYFLRFQIVLFTRGRE